MKKITVDGKTLKLLSFEEAFGHHFKSPSFVKAYNEERAKSDLVYQIKKLRMQKRWTQKMLAKKADMPQSAIARIESCNHSFSLGTLYRIAKVFKKEIQLV